MKCAHLAFTRPKVCCEALKSLYVPSQFEIEEYCTRKEHRKCPFYLRGIIWIDQAEIDSEVAHL
jgi:hypothetical protein